MTGRIRVGVIGGGLAGITVAVALAKHPHVDVHVYESAPQFTERGAGIGLSPLALEALDDIIPSAIDLLKTQAGAVEADAARLVIGSGPEAGALVVDLGEAAGLTMNRAPLLQTLLSLLSEDMLHAGRRLKSLEQSDAGVAATFEDGTDAHFDAVIGADGIFSSVRDHVLGGKEYAASPAGWWDCRHLVPFDNARAALGDESFKVDRQYAWLGDGAAMLHGLVENKTMVQCIIAVIDKSFSVDRKREVTRKSLDDALSASWYEGPVAKGMVELIFDQESPKGYAEWEHKTTPTYANKRVCIVGDAAHATSPWQGAGAGISIEDAFLIGHLLGKISSAGEIDAAFKAFDALRRPRCQQVVDNGRRTGRLFCGQDEVAGLNAEKLSRELGLMFAPLGTLDLKSHKEDALGKMRTWLGK
ncbi:FAD/NAD(P)-binding domain-containing protein [Xylariomycetidae sp. FL0641]|nr:FAD/NAD(P)-binding domain-containing protein [Xylariomycetidae sp. FL0641]